MEFVPVNSRDGCPICLKTFGNGAQVLVFGCGGAPVGHVVCQPCYDGCEANDRQNIAERHQAVDVCPLCHQWSHCAPVGATQVFYPGLGRTDDPITIFDSDDEDDVMEESDMESEPEEARESKWWYFAVTRDDYDDDAVEWDPDAMDCLHCSLDYAPDGNPMINGVVCFKTPAEEGLVEWSLDVTFRNPVGRDQVREVVDDLRQRYEQKAVCSLTECGRLEEEESSS